MADGLDRAIGEFRQVDGRAHIDREQRKAGENQAEESHAVALVVALLGLWLRAQQAVLRDFADAVLVILRQNTIRPASMNSKRGLIQAVYMVFSG